VFAYAVLHDCFTRAGKLMGDYTQELREAQA
jgi:hypothetical protein